MALALEFVHSAGIAHLDVKPGNVLLGPKGEVKLADFGEGRGKERNMHPAGCLAMLTLINHKS